MYACIHVYMIYGWYTSYLLCHINDPILHRQRHFVMLDTKHLPMLGHFKPPQISWGHTFWQHYHTFHPRISVNCQISLQPTRKKVFFFNGESFPSSIMTTRLTRQNWHLRPFFPEVSARGETWANHEGTSLWSISPFASKILDVWCFTFGEFQPSFNFKPVYSTQKLRHYTSLYQTDFRIILCVLLPRPFWDYQLNASNSKQRQQCQGVLHYLPLRACHHIAHALP